MNTGYIFQFQGAAFSPEGKQGTMTAAEIVAHNAQVQSAELEAMKATGKAILYLFPTDQGYSVGTWASKPHQRASCTFRQSRNNWGAVRTDVWFQANGQNWWGVNIGDNDIVRCKRLKA